MIKKCGQLMFVFVLVISFMCPMVHASENKTTQQFIQQVEQANKQFNEFTKKMADSLRSRDRNALYDAQKQAEKLEQTVNTLDTTFNKMPKSEKNKIEDDITSPNSTMPVRFAIWKTNMLQAIKGHLYTIKTATGQELKDYDFED